MCTVSYIQQIERFIESPTRQGRKTIVRLVLCVSSVTCLELALSIERVGIALVKHYRSLC